MNLLKISPVLFSLALGACVIDDGDDTDASETGTASATATMTATDPTATDTDPSTTDEPTSATQPTTDADSSTGADSTDTGSTGADSTDSSGTDTGGVGLCGWIEKDGIYGCGGVGEDPSKTFPIECAEVPVEGEACDAKAGPITSVGCCADANTEAFCSEDKGGVSVAVFACE